MEQNHVTEHTKEGKVENKGLSPILQLILKFELLLLLLSCTTDYAGHTRQFCQTFSQEEDKNLEQNRAWHGFPRHNTKVNFWSYQTPLEDLPMPGHSVLISCLMILKFAVHASCTLAKSMKEWEKTTCHWQTRYMYNSQQGKKQCHKASLPNNIFLSQPWRKLGRKPTVSVWSLRYSSLSPFVGL